MESKKIIEVKNLKVKLKNGLIIDYGTFDIYSNDFAIFNGENGSGKSTFLKLFNNITMNGEIYWTYLEDSKISYYDKNNEKIDVINENEKLRSNIVTMDQRDNFRYSDTGYSYMYKHTINALDRIQISRKEKKEKIKDLKSLIKEYYLLYIKEQFGCDNYGVDGYFIFKHKKATSWSGGQQKMIHILAEFIKARILNLNLIIMDEPLNNLDSNNKMILNDLIQDARNQGAAVLVVTHCQIFYGINKNITIKVNKTKRINKAEVKGTIKKTEACLFDYKTSLLENYYLKKD